MKIRNLSLTKLWESNLYRPLHALIDTWMVATGRESPVKLIKNGKLGALIFTLPLVLGFALMFSTNLIKDQLKPGTISGDILPVSLFVVGGMCTLLSSIFLYSYAVDNFIPAKEFVRSVVALDKILLETGHPWGIASLPAGKQDIQKELRVALVREALLKLQAERQDRASDIVQKYDSRFRRLVEAIGDMGFKIEPWNSYYNEAEETLKSENKKEEVA